MRTFNSCYQSAQSRLARLKISEGMKAYIAKAIRRLMGAPISDNALEILSDGFKKPADEWTQIAIDSGVSHIYGIFIARLWSNGSGKLRVTYEDVYGNSLNLPNSGEVA